MSQHELGYWLVTISLLIAIPLLTGSRPIAGRLARRWLRRLGSWALDRLRPDPEVDPVADELYRVFRREQLRSDIQRLQLILATDMSMSATRQLGNRLAYDWLVRELNRICSLLPSVADAGASSSWDVSAHPLRTTPLISGQGSRGPTVEILDIGWRG